MVADGSGASRSQLIAVFVVAAVVFVVALTGALVSAGAADFLVGSDEDGLNASARRSDGSQVTTTADRTTGSTTNRTADSSPSSAAPTESTTSTTTAPARVGSEEQAIAFMREKLESCVSDQGLDPATFSVIEYSAVATTAPGGYTVSLTAPPPGGTATFTVDLAAGTIASVDELATDFIAACPNFQ